MAFRILHYYIPLFFDLSKIFLFSSIFTAVVETVFFFLCGYSKKTFLIFLFAVNIISNITLNIVLAYLPPLFRYVIAGEVSVAVAEFIVFYVFIRPEGKEIIKLFLLTVAANLITYFAGKILFDVFKIL